MTNIYSKCEFYNKEPLVAIKINHLCQSVHRVAQEYTNTFLPTRLNEFSKVPLQDTLLLGKLGNDVRFAEKAVFFTFNFKLGTTIFRQ